MKEEIKELLQKYSSINELFPIIENKNILELKKDIKDTIELINKLLPYSNDETNKKIEKNLKNAYITLKDQIESLEQELNKENEPKKTSYKDVVEKYKKERLLNPVKEKGFFQELNETLSKYNDKNKQKIDNDKYPGLTDAEIELVKSGKYEPWEFEEEELEDDDYYNEDPF